MAADLALKLVSLVAPNYPFLESTSIPVLDLTACVLHGTADQQKTAADVRKAIEEIMGLEQGDPVRRHFQERIYAPLPPPHASTTPRASEQQMAPAAAPAPRQLPTEIIHQTLSYMLLDREDEVDDLELVCFQHLRLVGKAIKTFTETRFPCTFTRHISRVVKDLVHCKERHPNIAKDAYSASALLQQARTLHICVHGDEMVRLNNFLPACVYLERLVLFLGSADVHLGGLFLDRNVHLQELDVRRGRAVEFVTDDDIGVYRETEVDEDDVEEWLDAQTCGPTSLRSCRVSGGHLREALLDSILGLVGSTKLASLTLAGGGATFDESSLVAADCTTELCLEGGFSDATVEALGLGARLFLEELDVSDNELTDPRPFNLGTNKSLTLLDVSGNPLRTFAFNVGANSTLRVLNLAHSIVMLSLAEKRDMLGDLARQLRTNVGLTSIFLGGNDIDDAALEDFDLSDNVGLRYLSLSRNERMSSAGLRSINFSTHPKLRKVYVAHTQVLHSDTPEFTTRRRKIIVDDEFSDVK